MKFSYHKKEFDDPDNPTIELVTTDYDLVERKDSYVLNGSIREWEKASAKGKKLRCVCIDLDKPLTIEGDVIINGYLNSQRNVFVKGIYKIGDKYEAPK